MRIEGAALDLAKQWPGAIGFCPKRTSVQPIPSDVTSRLLEWSSKFGRGPVLGAPSFANINHATLFVLPSSGSLLNFGAAPARPRVHFGPLAWLVFRVTLAT